jgi:hypothetical protein
LDVLFLQTMKMGRKTRLNMTMENIRKVSVAVEDAAQEVATIAKESGSASSANKVAELLEIHQDEQDQKEEVAREAERKNSEQTVKVKEEERSSAVGVKSDGGGKSGYLGGAQFAVGDPVEVRFGGKAAWYPGKIKTVGAALDSASGVAAAAAAGAEEDSFIYAIEYDDGDEEAEVAELLIRAVAKPEVAEKVQPAALPAASPAADAAPTDGAPTAVTESAEVAPVDSSKLSKAEQKAEKAKAKESEKEKAKADKEAKKTKQAAAKERAKQDKEDAKKSKALEKTEAKEAKQKAKEAKKKLKVKEKVMEFASPGGSLYTRRVSTAVVAVQGRSGATIGGKDLEMAASLAARQGEKE